MALQGTDAVIPLGPGSTRGVELAFEVDHVFVCVGDEAQESAAIAALSEFGLDLTTRRTHQGQGTRNACACFDNAYLELLCPVDDAALGSELVAPLMLRERIGWRDTGACPFGVSLRCLPNPEGIAAVKTWAYSPPYLPEGVSIPIVTPRGSPDEPLVFLSRSPAPVDLPADRQPPLIQRGARRRLTGLRIEGPGATSVCAEARAVLADAGVVLEVASGPHVELEWDGREEGCRTDFSPVLPLSIRW